MMKRGVLYDVLYGFVPITEWEEEIINSPFFQLFDFTFLDFQYSSLSPDYLRFGQVLFSKLFLGTPDLRV